MRNIFLFIRRFSTALLFLVLQGVAIWFMVTYNKFHRAKGLGIANEVTGWFSSRYNTVEDFFKMKEENRRLIKQNDSLMNLLPSNFSKIDTSATFTRDSIPYDTLGHFRHYVWREAQVVYSTVNAEKNYVQINRGSNQGIKDDMGVFSSDGGLVGKVVNVGPNFSQIMSLLHVQSNVNVMVRRTSSRGSLSWDAKDPRYLRLDGVSRSDSVVKGDTVVTGIFSLSYPPGHLVGTVEEIVQDKSTNFLILKIKSTANFADLQQVMLVENLQYEEQRKLDEETRKQINDSKKAGP